MTKGELSSRLSRQISVGEAIKPRFRFGLGLILLGTAFALTTWALYTFVTSPRPAAVDFLPLWLGGRALILAGESPYSQAVTDQSQLAIYGQLADRGMDQLAFAYPLYTLFVLLPLVLLPYPLAQAAWMTLLLFALLASSFLTLRAFNYDSRGSHLLTIGFWTVLFYPAARCLALGQYAVIVLFWAALAFAAISDGRDLLAGLSLALATAKPQMVFLVVPLLLLWAWWHRRWRIVAAFAITLAMLLLLSTLWQPDWVSQFLSRLGQYQQYVSLEPPVYVLSEALVGKGASPIVPLLLAAVMIAYMLYTWRRSLSLDWHPFRHTLFLTMVVTLYVAPRTSVSDQVLLIVPLTAWFASLAQTGRKWLSLAAIGALIVLPWTYFWATQEGWRETSLMTLPLPLIVLGILLWQKQPDLQKHRSNPIRLSLLGCALILMFALQVYFTYAIFTSKQPGANDFYVPWRGAQALLLQGQNPYSQKVTRQIQLALFGQVVPETQHQFAFAYPLYVALLLAPLVLLPYPQAEAIWLCLLLWTLMGGVFLAMKVWGPRPRLRSLTVLTLGSILFYPSARSLILGQLSIVVFGLLVVALWAYQWQKDWLTGAALALSTIKPQMVFLLVPLFLLHAIHQWRWKLVIGFALTLVTLITVPMLLQPAWPLHFLEGLRQYLGYTQIGSPLQIVSDAILSQGGDIAATMAGLLLVGYLLYQWWKESQHGWGRWPWLVSLTIAVTLTVATRTATTNQLLLLLPLFLWLKMMDHQRTWPSWGVALLLVGLLLLPWFLFLATVQGDVEQPIMYVPLPLFFLFLLWYQRTSFVSR
ncbi:MAG: glycosyltransferase family 87 protein [Anaerolineae bacterium]